MASPELKRNLPAFVVPWDHAYEDAPVGQPLQNLLGLSFTHVPHRRSPPGVERADGQLRDEARFPLGEEEGEDPVEEVGRRRTLREAVQPLDEVRRQPGPVAVDLPVVLAGADHGVAAVVGPEPDRAALRLRAEAPAAEVLPGFVPRDRIVEIEWGAETTHCRGGVRPQGDGVRLLYKGTTDATGPLLIVFGLVPLRAGESARNVPANLTLVREGTGQFYATRGQDKCAFDEVRQTPVEAAPNLYRLEGRGYCTQPARALAGDGAVLISRFDVVAIVDASISGAGP